MARWFGRIVLILGALLAPVWLCAMALGLESVAREVTSSVTMPGPGGARGEPVSMAPAGCPEEDASAAVVEINDDDANAVEMLPPGGAPRVQPSDLRSAGRISKRAGAGPPLVHLEVQTPPPRA